MIIQTLLNKVNEEKPNSFTDAKLISFINEIEVEVALQMKYEQEDIPQYENNATDKAKTLLAPAPYDKLYVSYLKAMIDFANEEYASYQNNQVQHVQDFGDFSNWVVRESKEVEGASHIPCRFRNVF